MSSNRRRYPIQIAEPTDEEDAGSLGPPNTDTSSENSESVARLYADIASSREERGEHERTEQAGVTAQVPLTPTSPSAESHYEEEPTPMQVDSTVTAGQEDPLSTATAGTVALIQSEEQQGNEPVERVVVDPDTLPFEERSAFIQAEFTAWVTQFSEIPEIEDVANSFPGLLKEEVNARLANDPDRLTIQDLWTESSADVVGNRILSSSENLEILDRSSSGAESSVKKRSPHNKIPQNIKEIEMITMEMGQAVLNEIKGKVEETCGKTAMEDYEKSRTQKFARRFSRDTGSFANSPWVPFLTRMGHLPSLRVTELQSGGDILENAPDYIVQLARERTDEFPDEEFMKERYTSPFKRAKYDQERDLPGWCLKEETIEELKAAARKLWPGNHEHEDSCKHQRKDVCIQGSIQNCTLRLG